MAKKETAREAMQSLRQKAPRALMVLERHKAEPTLSLFEPTLVPVTTAFMASYDATHSYQMGRPVKSQAQARAMRHVAQRTDVWLAFLVRDVPGLDASEYDAPLSSAVNVIAAGERLLTFVNDLMAQQAEPVYAPQLVADLTEALRVARQDWADARGSLGELQTRQAETRTLALAFERELAAFRRAAKAILGESNTDYQSLRPPRRSKPVVEEVVAPEAVVQPEAQPQPKAQPQPPVVLNGAASLTPTFHH